MQKNTSWKIPDKEKAEKDGDYEQDKLQIYNSNNWLHLQGLELSKKKKKKSNELIEVRLMSDLSRV